MINEQGLRNFVDQAIVAMPAISPTSFRAAISVRSSASRTEVFSLENCDLHTGLKGSHDSHYEPGEE